MGNSKPGISESARGALRRGTSGRSPVHSTLRASFVLGMVGCIFGVFAAVFAALLGSFIVSFGGSSDLAVNAILAIVGSVIGIAGGAMGKKLGGILLIVAGIVVLVGVSLFGALTFILFVVGGILALREKPAQLPVTMSPPQSVAVQTSRTAGSGKFCRQCGTSLVQSREHGARFCPNCGAPIQITSPLS